METNKNIKKILLINIDSIIDNLALKKIEMYYQQQGAEIIWNNPLFKDSVDKIFVSCIFTKNKLLCKEWEGIADIGGTGYDIYKKLPAEIEAMNPKINMGFTLRGCIRNCSFCFVPSKEGKLKRVADLYDIWDGKSKEIILLDNNILADKEHFNYICQQAQKEKIKLDFNQGIDFRLIDKDIALTLHQTKIKEYRLALDDNKYIKLFKKKLDILRELRPKLHPMVYVLVGFNSTFAQDMERLLFLKENKCRPYVMRYEKVRQNRKYINLARWANQQFLFFNYSFEEFLEYDEEYRSNVYSAKKQGIKLKFGQSIEKQQSLNFT